MHRHFAIASHPQQNTRWQHAFPQGQLCLPAEVKRIGRGDCAWVMAEDEWPSRVAALNGRGAIIVVMANNPVSEQALQALAAGARGYIHALLPPATLQQVEMIVMNNGLWVGADLLAQVAGVAFDALSGDKTQIDHLDELTERERMVARAVANGRTNKEVARELDITERTVKAHLSSIFGKLDVKNRLQLVRLLAKPNYA